MKTHTKKSAIEALIFCVFFIFLATSGCMDMKGGAVELQWVVRDTNQRARECAEVGISHIRISIVQSTEDETIDLCKDPETDVGRCTFKCDVGNGTTPFKIPEGWYHFGLVALDEDGMVIPANLISIPSPIFRRVLYGEILDLGVWQITVNASDD